MDMIWYNCTIDIIYVQVYMYTIYCTFWYIYIILYIYILYIIYNIIYLHITYIHIIISIISVFIHTDNLLWGYFLGGFCASALPASRAGDGLLDAARLPDCIQIAHLKVSRQISKNWVPCPRVLGLGPVR